MVRGLLTGSESAFFKPFVIERGPKRGRPPADHRRVLDAVFWIARTGSPWRDLPRELGRWASVYKQFLRWTRSGLWDVLLETLAQTGIVPDRADGRLYHRVGALLRRQSKGGLASRVWGAREGASRPRFISVRMQGGCPLAS